MTIKWNTCHLKPKTPKTPKVPAPKPLPLRAGGDSRQTALHQDLRLTLGFAFQSNPRKTSDPMKEAGFTPGILQVSSSWWLSFNPFEKYAKVKLDHETPGIRDENKKIFQTTNQFVVDHKAQIERMNKLKRARAHLVWMNIYIYRPFCGKLTVHPDFQHSCYHAAKHYPHQTISC